MAALSEKKCIVIMGAGASFDVHIPGSTNDPTRSWRPPLTKDLFDPRFSGLLNTYPSAKLLGYELTLSASKGTLNLEDKLREYATHSDALMRRHFKDIPLYLRNVFFNCSSQYYLHSGAHCYLVQKLLAEYAHRVLFITLNYDDLLERILGEFTREPIVNLDDYISKDRRALVVKLHGSIDWVTPLAVHESSMTWENVIQQLDIDNRPTDIWKTTPAAPFSPIHFMNPYRNYFVYPVLTAPLAGKGPLDVVCPQKHVAAVTEFGRDCSKVLIIGSSGLDSDLLGILAASLKRVEFVQYVGSDDIAECRKRFEKDAPMLSACKESHDFSKGYAEFVQDEAFTEFLTS